MKRVARDSGFTIIELMIATAIFSLVLLLLATGVITVTKQYIQGVNESHTQSVARNIVTTIGQAIQFDGDTPQLHIASNYFCLGTKRYTLTLNSEVSDSPVRHALQQDTPASCAPTSPLSSPTEFVSPNMRLENLDICQSGSNTDVYNINVRIVYGNDNTLSAPFNKTDNCGVSHAEHNCASANLLDMEFCAVSELDTTVQQRVNNN